MERRACRRTRWVGRWDARVVHVPRAQGREMDWEHHEERADSVEALLERLHEDLAG